jgi:hypothetical protein
MQNARDPGERPQPSEAAWDIVDMLRETRTDVSNAVGVEWPSAGLADEAVCLKWVPLQEQGA